MRRRPRLLGGLGLAATACVWACSTLTGASEYTEVTRCTGPTCGIQCGSQGGTWDASTSTCTCASGSPICGGICCDTTVPNCVTTLEGALECSACTASKYECGRACCEEQTCLNASIGACGYAYGRTGQSCGNGLTCPIPRLDGTTEEADCCERITLARPPTGTFPMGRDPTGKNACSEEVQAIGPCDFGELPQHTVSLSAYGLDRFEVTVGRFRKFVESWDYRGLPAGAGGDAVVAGVGWQTAWNANLPASKSVLLADVTCQTAQTEVAPHPTWTNEAGAGENLPITCVTWYEAFAFCVWDGGRLPTEAEWEFAAANGSAGDLYPWGQADPAPDLVPPYGCGEACSASAVKAVGSFPKGANLAGHRDLAGNVREWVFDTLSVYPPAAEHDFADVTDGYRVERGGDVADTLGFLRAASRASNSPQAVASHGGFRCARTP